MTSWLLGVLGNLAASAILGIPALWHLHRRLGRQHRIVADLFEHHTGRAHPDAPAPDSGNEAE